MIEGLLQFHRTVLLLWANKESSFCLCRPKSEYTELDEDSCKFNLKPLDFSLTITIHGQGLNVGGNMVGAIKKS